MDNTETPIRVDITSMEMGKVVTRGGSYDSLETMVESIKNFVGVDNLISIEIRR